MIHVLRGIDGGVQMEREHHNNNTMEKMAKSEGGRKRVLDKK
jgi:hypothetical protein